MEWKKLASENIHEGWRKVDRVTFQLPHGESSDYEIKREADTVCIVALTEDQRVVLVKQFRPGPEKVLLEIPGGVIDKGEEPLEAARRELLEETGFTGEFQLAGTQWVDAYSTGKRNNFIALNCTVLQEPENNPHEPIEVVTVSLDEFREHLQSGELTDVETGYMCLDFAGLLEKSQAPLHDAVTTVIAEMLQHALIQIRYMARNGGDAEQVEALADTFHGVPVRLFNGTLDLALFRQFLETYEKKYGDRYEYVKRLDEALATSQ